MYERNRYLTYWVCLNCRFSGKAKPSICDPRTVRRRCPPCGEWTFVDAGHDFQEPKEGDKNGWTTVIALLARGIRYDTRDIGPSYRPRPVTQFHGVKRAW